MSLSFHAVALLIEALGSAYLAGAVLAALLALVRGESRGRLERARLLVADGAVAALSFKVAASLLKLAEVQTWSQIGLFAVVLAPSRCDHQPDVEDDPWTSTRRPC